MASPHRHAETAQQQGELWGGRANDWAEVQERFSLPAYQAVAVAAGIGPGTTVLDIGCGAGGFCLLADGLGARVNGLDASAGLLRIAADRTPEGNFALGDMQQLPFADGAFDVVTGFNSFQHAVDPQEALNEARRAVRAGGIVAAVVWGQEDGCELPPVIEAIHAALAPSEAGEDPGAGGRDDGCFAGDEKQALFRLLDAAGLSAGRSMEIDCPMHYPDRETMLRGLMSPGPLVQAIEVFGQGPVGRAVESAMARHRQRGGGYRLNNRLFAVMCSPSPVSAEV